MEDLTKTDINCLIIQSKFSEFSYWNYTEVCNIAGAKYPTAPLGLLTMAALMPQNWNFQLIDENVEDLKKEHFTWADLVCTGGMLPQQSGTLEIIAKAHENGKRVVVGGPDPTSQPDIYKDADFLVCGEGEVTIPLFLEDMKKGRPRRIYKTDQLADMSKAVIPRFDLIQFEHYLNVGVQYSRGCPFNCEFCDIIELYGRKPRMKTNTQVLKELQTLYDLGYRGHVDFVDDNFIGNKSKVKSVLKDVYIWSEQNKFPFFFSTEASINLADDEELLELMRNVDFRYVFVGIETPDDNLLKEMGKKQNVNKPISQMIERILDYGIIVNGGFIMGFDCETSSTAENMIQLIENSGIALAMLGLLYALPNTQLTRRLQKEGRMNRNSMQLEQLNAIDQITSGLNFETMRPKKQILRDFAHVNSTIYSPENYFKRVEHIASRIELKIKHKYGFRKSIYNLRSFLRLTIKLGFQKKTGKLYWETLFKVAQKNIKGLETAVNLAAMFIHFQKQTDYVLELTHKKIRQESSKVAETTLKRNHNFT